MDTTNTAIIALIFTNIIGPIFSYQIAKRKTKDDFLNTALQNRYKLLYCPLRDSLLGTHIASGARGLSLDERFNSSLSYFKRLKFRYGVKKLLKKYSDREYEVEY